MSLDLDVCLGDADAVVGAAWAEAWAVAPELLVSEWATLHRKLPAQSSNERGYWNNARHPMLVEIMDCLSEHHPAERIVLRKPTQWGGTEVLLNALGYYMQHAEPSPMLLVVPGLEMAKRHAKQRINPSIELSPAWREAVPPPRSRDASNTDMYKEFRGEGTFIIATANSSTGLRSMPVRIVLGDEVSKWKRDLDGEGSALEQVLARTSTYQGSRKILLISSPTIEGLCIISDEYNESDQREYYVHCPHCHHEHTWQFEFLLSDGRMICPSCGETYGEEHKTRMMSAECGAHWRAKFPEREKVGFHANALYTPYRMGESWATLAAERDRAEKDPERLIAFTQTRKALPFAGARDRADDDEMKQRREPGLLTGIVPRGYYLLTVGVDCQADRFAVQVLAWGPGERAVVVWWEEIPGDPSDQDGYRELDAFLTRTYAKGSLRIVPRCVAIDGGNWTEEVAKFVRTRQRRMVATGGGYAEQFVVAVRGRSTETTRVVNRPRKTETNARGKTIARSVGVWGVGTVVAKNILFGRINADANAESIDDRRIRFPGGLLEIEGRDDSRKRGLQDDYFKQLTAEYYDKAVNRWIHEKSIRNEAIDTLVYAYFAALHPHVRLDLIKDHEWDALKQMQEPSSDDLFAACESPDQDTAPSSFPDASRETSVSDAAPPAPSTQPPLPTTPPRPAGVPAFRRQW